MPKVITARMTATCEKQTPENHVNLSASFTCCTPHADICHYLRPASPANTPCTKIAASHRSQFRMSSRLLEACQVARGLHRMTEERGLDNNQEPSKAGQQKQWLQGRAAGTASRDVQGQSAMDSKHRRANFSAALHLPITPQRFGPRLGGSAWQSLSPDPQAECQGARRGFSQTQARWREKDPASLPLRTHLPPHNTQPGKGSRK